MGEFKDVDEDEVVDRCLDRERDHEVDGSYLPYLLRDV